LDVDELPKREEDRLELFEEMRIQGRLTWITSESKATAGRPRVNDPFV
jgi:hypothetical protein